MPDSPPLVTVVVTVYQRTEFLREALGSALAQSLGEIEVLVTDDSNSAAIRAICEDTGASEEARGRLRYRTNAERLGVARNLAAAIAEARGRYVSILNDDDAWETRFLERLVRPLEEDERRVLAFSDHWIVSANGTTDVAATEHTTRQYGRDRLKEGEITFTHDLVLEQNAVPLAMAAVFRLAALPPDALVREVAGAYDFWISATLAATGRPFYYVAERLTRYRTHGAMETHRRAPDKSDNGVYIYGRLLVGGAFPAHQALLRRRLAEALFAAGRDRMYFDAMPAARERFRAALRTRPTIRNVAGLLASYAPSPLRRALGFTAPG
jgi:glycosyltransferase involved in cell wall biosynthesis